MPIHMTLSIIDKMKTKTKIVYSGSTVLKEKHKVSFNWFNVTWEIALTENKVHSQFTHIVTL